jgi:HD-GYP domain-containing protein (c-di-GMP phosphodiesterase class II)
MSLKKLKLTPKTPLVMPVGGPSPEQLLDRFGALLNESGDQQSDSEAMSGAGLNFLKTLRPFLVYHSIARVSRDEAGRCFLNGNIAAAQRRNEERIVKFLTDLQIFGLTFSGNWSKKSIGEFLDAVAKSSVDDDPADRLHAFTLQTSLIQLSAKVAVWFNRPNRENIQPVEDRDKALTHYARLTTLAEATHKAVARGHSPDIHLDYIQESFRQIIGSLDIPTYETRLLGVTVLAPQPSNLGAIHASNVAIFSVLMGRLLGLPLSELVSLGIAAYQHDLGRADSTSRNPTKAQVNRETEIRNHVCRGVFRSLRARAYNHASLLRIIVNHEHHRLSDIYPPGHNLRKAHIFSELVSVADSFDRLQHDPYEKSVSPMNALKTIIKSPSRYRPAAVKLLKNVVGSIPRGTLLRLKNGDCCVVVCGGAKRGDRPIVRRLSDSNGERDEQWTLSEISPEKKELDCEIEDWPTDEWRQAVIA